MDEPALNGESTVGWRFESRSLGITVIVTWPPSALMFAGSDTHNDSWPVGTPTLRHQKSRLFWHLRAPEGPGSRISDGQPAELGRNFSITAPLTKTARRRAQRAGGRMWAAGSGQAAGCGQRAVGRRRAVGSGLWAGGGLWAAESDLCA